MIDPQWTMVEPAGEEGSIQIHESNSYSEGVPESGNSDKKNQLVANRSEAAQDNSWEHVNTPGGQQPEPSEPTSDQADREPLLRSSGHRDNNSSGRHDNNSSEKLCIEKVKILTVTMLVLTTILLLIVIVGIICLFTTVLKPQLYNFNAAIGDVSESESTFLLQINSTIASATVKAIDPDLELKANIYQSMSKPPEYIEVLDTVTIHELNGKNRFRYNYFKYTDNPVYLTPGSSLIYDVSISSNSGSTCPARLYLFNNQTTYFLFISDRNSKIDSTDSSPCLFPDNGAWSFNITDSSTYYVGIAIDTGVSATGNVMVERIQYNTTELQLDTQLTSASPSRTFTTCDTRSRFQCTGIDDTYLILSINEESLINFQLKTFYINGGQKKALFISPVVVFALLLIFEITFIIMTVIIFIRHKSTTANGARVPTPSVNSPQADTNAQLVVQANKTV